MAVTWSDDVDEILAGDLVAGLAYLTPAKGVVISPIAPLGLRDRDRGTVTVTTSLALWKKLDRIRRNPGVAMAYHTRDLGQTDRPGFVLVQGQASFSSKPDRAWLESIEAQWNRDLAPRKGGLVGRMLRTHYWERVAIDIAVVRVARIRTRRRPKSRACSGGSSRPALHLRRRHATAPNRGLIPRRSPLTLPASPTPCSVGAARTTSRRLCPCLMPKRRPRASASRFRPDPSPRAVGELALHRTHTASA